MTQDFSRRGFIKGASVLSAAPFALNLAAIGRAAAATAEPRSPHRASCPPCGRPGPRRPCPCPPAPPRSRPWTWWRRRWSSVVGEWWTGGGGRRAGRAVLPPSSKRAWPVFAPRAHPHWRRRAMAGGPPPVCEHTSLRTSSGLPRAVADALELGRTVVVAGRSARCRPGRGVVAGPRRCWLSAGNPLAESTSALEFAQGGTGRSWDWPSGGHAPPPTTPNPVPPPAGWGRPR